MVVSDRLRAFFNHLKQQFSPDTEELLNRVESKQDDDKKKT